SGDDITGDQPTIGHDAVSPGAVVHSAGFRWMSVAFFLQTLAAIAITVHLIAFLTERGDGATFAATAAGLIGAAQVAARVIVTALEHHVSLSMLTIVVFLLQAAALALLLTWSSPAGVIVAVVALGMGKGSVTLLRPGLLANLYGRHHFGTINGMQTVATAAARALAPVATGAAYTFAGGYPPAVIRR